MKTIYVSGQVGEGDDFQTHVESAFAGVVERLAQAGATVRDVVKIRAFVKGMTADRFRPVAEVRRATFPEGSWPASTVAGVQALARDPLLVEVEAVAVVAADGVDLTIERFGASNGFSAAVAVTAHGVKTIYVSGQVGRGDDLAAQTASVWERVGQRLGEAGASFTDLVKTTSYVVGFDPEVHMTTYRAGYPDALTNAGDKPASTLLGIPALANERFRIEIDGIAVVGADGRSIDKEFIDPARTFTQAVTARGTGPKTIYLAGQVGRPGDSLADQADQVYANLKRRLEAAGASPSDLLKVTLYMARLHRGGPDRARPGPRETRLHERRRTRLDVVRNSRPVLARGENRSRRRSRRRSIELASAPSPWPTSPPARHADRRGRSCPDSASGPAAASRRSSRPSPR